MSSQVLTNLNDLRLLAQLEKQAAEQANALPEDETPKRNQYGRLHHSEVTAKPLVPPMIAVDLNENTYTVYEPVRQASATSVQVARLTAAFYRYKNYLVIEKGNVTDE